MTVAPLSTAFRSLVGLGGVFTSAKSFEDNPVLSSRWLNQAGLHAARVTWAHRVATSRRARLAHLVSEEDRASFARDGYILKRDVAPDFASLLAEVKSYRTAAREMIQGDTLTRKIALDDAARAGGERRVAQPARLCRRHDDAAGAVHPNHRHPRQRFRTRSADLFPRRHV